MSVTDPGRISILVLTSSELSLAITSKEVMLTASIKIVVIIFFINLYFK